jgi:hypothetical protein
MKIIGLILTKPATPDSSFPCRRESRPISRPPTFTGQRFASSYKVEIPLSRCWVSLRSIQATTAASSHKPARNSAGNSETGGMLRMSLAYCPVAIYEQVQCLWFIFF